MLVKDTLYNFIEMSYHLEQQRPLKQAYENLHTFYSKYDDTPLLNVLMATMTADQNGMMDDIRNILIEGNKDIIKAHDITIENISLQSLIAVLDGIVAMETYDNPNDLLYLLENSEDNEIAFIKVISFLTGRPVEHLLVEVVDVPDTLIDMIKLRLNTNQGETVGIMENTNLTEFNKFVSKYDTPITNMVREGILQTKMPLNYYVSLLDSIFKYELDPSLLAISLVAVTILATDDITVVKEKAMEQASIIYNNEPQLENTIIIRITMLKVGDE